MKKTILFITALNDLEVAGNLGRGDKITPDIFITNDSHVVKSLAVDPFPMTIGSLEASAILNSRAVIYSVQELPKEFVPQEFLIKCIRIVKFFLNILWLVKDNSVNSEIGFLQYPCGEGIACDSNFVAVLYSNSSGKKEPVRFDREELRRARHLFSKNFDLELNDASYKPSIFKKGKDRLSRAYSYLQIARSTNDLALKISNYVTTSEALFSTSVQELSHQLSERVAFFIGETPEERRLIFGDIKKAYEVRSIIVHGGVLKAGKLESLENISQVCDNVLRKSFQKVFSNTELKTIFSKPSDKFEEYFLNLIFGLGR